MMHAGNVIIILSIITTQPLFTDGNTIACNGASKYRYRSPENKCQCLEFIFSPQLLFDSAKSACQSKSAELLTIRSREKQDYVRDILQKTSSKRGVWLGAERNSQGQFVWIDNNELVSSGYSSWAPGEPDNQIDFQNCALMHEQNYWSWKDFFCTFEEYSYVCQTDIDCDEETLTGSLSTGEIVGIVVGGIFGLIIFFAILFALLNCLRGAVKRKRSANTQSVRMSDLESHSRVEAHPMIHQDDYPPPYEEAVKGAGSVGVGGLAAAAVVAGSHPHHKDKNLHHQKHEDDDAEEDQNAANNVLAESSQPHRSESPRDLNRLDDRASISSVEDNELAA